VGDLVDAGAVNKATEDKEGSIGSMGHGVIITRRDVSLKNKTATFELRNRYKIGAVVIYRVI